MGTYQALSWGSLTEAVYQALCEDPTNPQLRAVVEHGMEAKVLNARMPTSVLQYKTRLHNVFHQGASASFVELSYGQPEQCTG